MNRPRATSTALPATTAADDTGARADGRHGPIVIAHRGASGYRPEHTLAAYRLAIRQGADFIEPDLVVTRDGVLIARHENDISATTDVAAHPEFADRRTRKRVDGKRITGWFSEDFTLREIKTLRAIERIPGLRPRNARFDGRFQVPTFAEVVQLAQRESRDGRVIGVYPETKHPSYFASEGRHLDGSPIGFSVGAALVATLLAEGLTDPQRVFIQSFEIANLIELRTRIMPRAGVAFPLVQLYGDLATARPYDIGYHAGRGDDLALIYGDLARHVDGGLHRDTRGAALATRAVLEWMKASYATAVGPWKGDLLPGDRAGAGRAVIGDPGARDERNAHPMLKAALGAGLLVHPYTLRAEPCYLAPAPDGAEPSLLAEVARLCALGVHGFFIDQPDVGVAGRALFLAGQRLRPER